MSCHGYTLSQRIIALDRTVIVDVHRARGKSLDAPSREARLAVESQIATSMMTGMVAAIRDAGVLATNPDRAGGRSVRLTFTPLVRSLKPLCLESSIELELLLGEDFMATEQMQLRRAGISVECRSDCSCRLAHRGDDGLSLFEIIETTGASEKSA